MRTPLHSLTNLLSRLGLPRKKHRSHTMAKSTRKLRFEQCEDRRMLAITVDVAHDETDLGDGVTTLREAIVEANNFPDVDATDFDWIGDHIGMTGATLADGDLTGDGVVSIEDLELAFAQFGLGLSVVI